MVARGEATPSVHRSGETVATKLHRIAEKACKESGFKFTSLYHLMNEELFRECFKRLKKGAAAGIDKMTKEMYAEKLEANLSGLTERVQRMVYIPQSGVNTYPSRAATNNALWEYPLLKTSLCRRDWFGYWNKYTSRTS
jgi:hypothetical protein